MGMREDADQSPEGLPEAVKEKMAAAKLSAKEVAALQKFRKTADKYRTQNRPGFARAFVSQAPDGQWWAGATDGNQLLFFKLDSPDDAPSISVVPWDPAPGSPYPPGFEGMVPAYQLFRIIPSETQYTTPPEETTVGALRAKSGAPIWRASFGDVKRPVRIGKALVHGGLLARALYPFSPSAPVLMRALPEDDGGPMIVLLDPAGRWTSVTMGLRERYKEDEVVTPEQIAAEEAAVREKHAAGRSEDVERAGAGRISRAEEKLLHRLGSAESSGFGPVHAGGAQFGLPGDVALAGTGHQLLVIVSPGHDVSIPAKDDEKTERSRRMAGEMVAATLAREASEGTCEAMPLASLRARLGPPDWKTRAKRTTRQVRVHGILVDGGLAARTLSALPADEWVVVCSVVGEDRVGGVLLVHDQDRSRWVAVTMGLREEEEGSTEESRARYAEAKARDDAAREGFAKHGPAADEPLRPGGKRSARPQHKKIVEYSEVNDSNKSRTQVHEAQDTLHKAFKLVSVTAGYEPAGSTARWTDGYFSAREDGTGTIFGKHFSTFSDAEKQYRKWVAEAEQKDAEEKNRGPQLDDVLALYSRGRDAIAALEAAESRAQEHIAAGDKHAAKMSAAEAHAQWRVADQLLRDGSAARMANVWLRKDQRTYDASKLLGDKVQRWRLGLSQLDRDLRKVRAARRPRPAPRKPYLTTVCPPDGTEVVWLGSSMGFPGRAGTPGTIEEGGGTAKCTVAWSTPQGVFRRFADARQFQPGNTIRLASAPALERLPEAVAHYLQRLANPPKRAYATAYTAHLWLGQDEPVRPENLSETVAQSVRNKLLALRKRWGPPGIRGPHSGQTFDVGESTITTTLEPIEIRDPVGEIIPGPSPAVATDRVLRTLPHPVQRYISSIRNARKKVYALQYAAYLWLGEDEPSSETSGLSFMGAQSVRIHLAAMKRGRSAETGAYEDEEGFTTRESLVDDPGVAFITKEEHEAHYRPAPADEPVDLAEGSEFDAELARIERETR